MDTKELEGKLQEAVNGPHFNQAVIVLLEEGVPFGAILRSLRETIVPQNPRKKKLKAEWIAMEMVAAALRNLSYKELDLLVNDVKRQTDDTLIHVVEQNIFSILNTPLQVAMYKSLRQWLAAHSEDDLEFIQQSYLAQENNYSQRYFG